MKNFLLILIFIYCSLSSYSQIFVVDTIYYHGDTDNRINLVIMGDGYVDIEMGQFRNDAQLVADYFFSIEPFNTYRNFFNIFAIEVISNESGTDHPGTANDENTPPQAITTVDTYLNTTFDWGGTHRCVFSSNSSVIYNVVNANVPFYDYINVLINTSYYGGCANNIAYTTMDASSPEIFVHEFGHMFAGLSDEYDYGNSSCNAGATQHINVSQQTDTSLLVWKKWLTATTYPTPNGTDCGSIGLYEGGNYCSSNWYRPKCECKMRNLGYPYCEVCYEQFIFSISAKVNYIESHSPVSTLIRVCDNTQQQFSVEILNTLDNTVRVQWFMDNVRVSGNTDTFNLDASQFTPGVHQLKAVAYDTTINARKTLNSYNFSWIVEILDAVVTTTDSVEFCAPDSAVLKSLHNPNYTYQWFNNNSIIPGASDSNLVVHNSGNYSVVINNGTCRDTSTQLNIVAHQQHVTTLNLTGNDTLCNGNTSLLSASLCATCTAQWKRNGISLAGAVNDTFVVYASGSYAIDVTDISTGCSAISNSTNIVEDSIVVSLTANQQVFCQNDSSEMNALSTGINNQWYLNNNIISGATTLHFTAQLPGDYYVVASDDACSDTSQTITLIVHPNPVVTFSGLPDTMCVYHLPVSLSGNPPGGNFISIGMTGNDFDPEVPGPGVHYVSYEFTDANSCFGEYTGSVFIDACSGVEENDFGNFISIIPNPSSGRIVVGNESGEIHKLSAVVFDLTGRKVIDIFRNENFDAGGKKEFDCTGLNSGIYLLHINSDTKTFLRRLTIMK